MVNVGAVTDNIAVVVAAIILTHTNFVIAAIPCLPGIATVHVHAPPIVTTTLGTDAREIAWVASVRLLIATECAVLS